MKEKPWQRHEKDVAEWFHSYRTPGSGAILERLDVQKASDGTTWRFAFECKSTCKGSFAVSVEKLWLETRERCYERSSEMRPAIPIRFIDEYERVRADLCLVDIHDLAELRERLDELSAANAQLTEHNRQLEELNACRIGDQP